MPLTPGTRIGPYEISAPLGAGGMGEVYRAHDSRLGRDVAVKALPASAGTDPDRVARFAREAQILAGLSHPHIAVLHGVEALNGSQFLVMELVEGGTLADRLAGPLQIRQSVEIGRQIADALQAAHERGIIHRDLKPANIGFTSDDHVKVLDFGLAKSILSDSAAETLAGATATGMVVGTAAYMSPEQARGLPLDKRSDIFSFGCVLFEMLTGRSPFAANSASDSVAGILNREPDWSLLPAQTPAHLRLLVRRCLEKEPRRRLQDIGDARLDLEETSHASASAVSGAVIDAPRGRSTIREALAWTAAAVGVIAAAVIWMQRSTPTDQNPDVASYHVLLQLPRLDALKNPEFHTRFAVSPDGRMVVMIGSTKEGSSQLLLRSLDSPTLQPLSGTEGASYPFWSADSRSVGFIWRPSSDVSTAAGKIKRVNLAGGEPLTLADTQFYGMSSWAASNVILFTPAGNSPLVRVDAARGGTPEPATTLDVKSGHVQHAHPFVLPDGNRFLYTAIGSRAGATAAAGIYLASLDRTTQPRLLVEGATQPSYASGHLTYVQGSTLFARPFDVARAEFTGEATVLVERLESGATGGGLTAAYSLGTTGVLAYQTAAPVLSELTWYDRVGKRLGSLGERADWVDVALSPDGSRLASSRLDPASGRRDIWVHDVSRGFAERATSLSGDAFAPVWSPSGDQLAFSMGRGGIIELYRLGSSKEPQLIDAGGLALGKFAASWSGDDTLLFIAGGRTLGRSDLMLLSVTGGPARVFADSRDVETQARFSPDSRWVAYSANHSGRLEVYVKPYGRDGEPRRVSVNGGRWPRWRRDQSEIVFLAPDDTVMSAAVTVTAEEIQVGEIRALFPVRLRSQVRLDAYPYDMTADAQRFVVNTFGEEARASDLLQLIINWPPRRTEGQD